MRTVVILQSRIGSTRLPGKALMDLAGESLTRRAMEALRLVKADAYVLATDDLSADSLAPVAAASGFSLTVGPRDDVLERYCMAIRESRAELVLRATGDNPLVSFELADLLMDRQGEPRADYSAWSGPPIGTGVELVRAEALLAAGKEALDPYEREHVCPFLYRRPERFVIERPPAPADFCAPGLSLTVDTAADFEKVRRIFAALYRGTPLPLASVIDYCRKEGIS
jgi:spore coat polysaccharide biosynthesis protein SpsF